MTSEARSIDELQRVVREMPQLRVRGGSTKSTETPLALHLSPLTGIVDYEPDECVITAVAATPLREITAVLQQHRQYLPFDPPFVQEGATIGGTVAAGVNGPGRYRYGGVRDFIIGVRIVDGEGRLIRSGGKVVKNAAGFLLHHGVVGSCGRFGVIAEVTLKVFPAPESRRCVSVTCASVEAAFALAREIEARRFDCEAVDFTHEGELRVTLAGRAAALEQRVERLVEALRSGQRPSGGTVPLIGDCPPAGGLSPQEGTPFVKNVKAESVVKVAGPMTSWEKLRAHVSAARFMCAGAVAWFTTDDPAALGRVLEEARLAGQVIRGAGAGDRIGYVPYNEFEERVRRVLDPHDRFSAAPHPSR